MLVPALFAAAAAISVVVELPLGSVDPRPHRVAMATADGAVMVSFDAGLSWSEVAHCSMPAPAADDAPAFRGQELHNDFGTEEALAEDPEGVSEPPSESVAAPSGEPAPGAWDPVAPDGCGPPGAAIPMAWFQDALYLACPGEPLRRWRASTGLHAVVPVSGPNPDAPSGQAPPRGDVVAMASGALLWLGSARNGLWTLDAGGRLSFLGATPEPISALARWRGALVAAGATAVWQGPAPWRALVTLRACALSAAGDHLWLAGPEGLVEMSPDEVHVHTVERVTGVAVHGEDIWLATGRGPPVRTGTRVAQLAIPAPAGDSGDMFSRVTVEHGSSRDVARRARWAPWLPRVVAELRWTRARSHTAAGTHLPWPDPRGTAHTSGITVLVLLSWRLGQSDAIAALQGGSPW